MPVVQRQNADVLSRIARFVRVATARLVEDFINKGKSHLMSSGSPSEVSQDVTMAAVFLKTTKLSSLGAPFYMERQQDFPHWMFRRLFKKKITYNSVYIS